MCLLWGTWPPCSGLPKLAAVNKGKNSSAYGYDEVEQTM